MGPTADQAFNHIQDYLKKNGAKHLLKTSSPNIFCSRLEPHWRSNKSLPVPFVVLITTPIPDGTEVCVAAGNDDSPCGEVRNDRAKSHKQVIRFNDLRFVGKSGRGKNFNLTVTVFSKPMMVAILPRVIKVTVDGPRDARTPKQQQSDRKRPYPFGPLGPLVSPVVPLPIFHPMVAAFQQSAALQHSMLQRNQLMMSLASSSLLMTQTAPVETSPDQRPTASLCASADTSLSGSSVFESPESRTSLPQSTPVGKRLRRSSVSSNESSPPIWRPFADP